MFSSGSSKIIGGAAGLALVLGIVGCGGTEEAPAPPPNPRHVAMFAPLPEVMESPANPITEEKVDLGRKLYYDTRLSKNQDVSCNTCHLLDNWGVDGKPTSAGHKGQLGPRNSPTVYNAAGQIAQFWDGREPDVEAQAKGPILNPVEMAMPSEEAVLRVVESIPGYVEEFAVAFPGQANPVTYDNLAKAIGAFERKLVTPSRFDAYLKGDGSALTATERRGLDKFIDVGCTTCHMGPYLGGNLYQKMGLVEPYPSEDEGRSAVTGNEAEKYFFKVPGLRNVAKTGPYLHDGSIDSLEEVVRIMGRYQLGKTIKPDEVMDIVAFLGALTGDLPMDYIKQPELPPSGPDTPAPDPS
ncbi:MAG TPA: cytochrome-c peroxidase [Acidobacteria bacterium]|nr:cytochrome-c peroxidase [Acidobacteriota bacterium]